MSYRNRPDRRRLCPPALQIQSVVLWSAGSELTTEVQVGFASPMHTPPGDALFWRSADGSAEGQSSAVVADGPSLFTFTLPVARPESDIYVWFKPLQMDIRSLAGGCPDEEPRHVTVPLPP